MVAFNPGVLVPGILPSADKLLQSRIFSYSDAQRYRCVPYPKALPIKISLAMQYETTLSPCRQSVQSQLLLCFPVVAA